MPYTVYSLNVLSFCTFIEDAFTQKWGYFINSQEIVIDNFMNRFKSNHSPKDISLSWLKLSQPYPYLSFGLKTHCKQNPILSQYQSETYDMLHIWSLSKASVLWEKTNAWVMQCYRNFRTQRHIQFLIESKLKDFMTSLFLFKKFSRVKKFLLCVVSWYLYTAGISDSICRYLKARVLNLFLGNYGDWNTFSFLFIKLGSFAFFLRPKLH